MTATNHPPQQPQFLTETDLATRQNRSMRTIQNERLRGGGIPFVKFGAAVRYRLSDVETWEHAHTFASTSQISNANENRR